MSSLATAVTKVKGNPGSAQPMPGLSARAQKRLAPARYGMGIAPSVPTGSIPQAFRTSKD